MVMQTEPTSGSRRLLSRKIAFWLLTPFTLPILVFLFVWPIGRYAEIIERVLPRAVQLFPGFVVVASIASAVAAWLYLWRLFKRHYL